MSKMADQWGPWIGWNGGECPVDENAIVQFVNAAGISKEVDAADLHWGVDYTFRVIAYRVKREPVVETVQVPVHVEWEPSLSGGRWEIWYGHHDIDDVANPILGRAVFETRDGIPDMTTLRWEDVE